MLAGLGGPICVAHVLDAGHEAFSEWLMILEGAMTGSFFEATGEEIMDLITI